MHLTGLAVVAAVVCCGLPLLLAAGSAVTVAGIGLRSWVLTLAGVAVVVLGAWEYRRRRSDRQAMSGTASGPRRS
ncbi:MAG: hypothetical protein NVS3B21_19560 [Acidimicrobiales bacterium]